MISKRYLLIPVGIILFLLLLFAPAQMSTDAAPAHSDYGIRWWTIDGGGAMSSGGGYVLMGTIGQADAFATLQGDGYSLEGGYWPGADPGNFIFLPMMQK